MSDDPGEFLITKEYRRFVEFCEACRRYRYIGLCHGPAGVGKTLSARQYTRWDLLEPALVKHRADYEPPPEVVTCHSVLYTPEVANTPRMVWDGIRSLMSSFDWAVQDSLPASGLINMGIDPPQRVELLIVDEADRLKVQSLEAIRDAYDRERFGVILIGMPGLERRLSRYAQLYSRVGFVHAFRPLSAEEMGFIVARHWERLGLTFAPDDFTDAEAMAAIVRITGGNFRLIHRLFTQIERILQINQIRLISKEVVETARQALVIGPA